MLVDDNPFDCFINTEMIKRQNPDIQTMEFLSALEALEYIKSIPLSITKSSGYFIPDLILLDINMPIMNGFEFLDQLNNIENFNRGTIDIYILTSSVLQNDIDKAFSKPLCTGYIAKPLNQEKLSKVLYSRVKRYYGFENNDKQPKNIFY